MSSVLSYCRASTPMKTTISTKPDTGTPRSTIIIDGRSPNESKGYTSRSWFEFNDLIVRQIALFFKETDW